MVLPPLTGQPLVAKADAESDPQRSFVTIRPAYEEAYRMGLATAFLPQQYGGGGATSLDLQVVADEICAVDPGFACVLLVNGLALMPLVWFGSDAQKEKWLRLATSDPDASFLAGWVVSEPAGIPGGTAMPPRSGFG